MERYNSELTVCYNSEKFFLAVTSYNSEESKMTEAVAWPDLQPYDLALTNALLPSPKWCPGGWSAGREG